MSSLLFVLVMEYLSRTLKCMCALPDFAHPMCKQVKLFFLLFIIIFSDDLGVIVFMRKRTRGDLTLPQNYTHGQAIIPQKRMALK